MFLMETKLVRGKGVRILKKFGFWNGWEVPRVGLSGGLQLGWQPNQKLTIMHSSKHLIHADLLDYKGTPLLITFFMVNLITQKERKFGLSLNNSST